MLTHCEIPADYFSNYCIYFSITVINKTPGTTEPLGAFSKLLTIFTTFTVSSQVNGTGLDLQMSHRYLQSSKTI